MSRIKDWTKMSNERLWMEWRKQFDNDQEAIATAIWIGNRLVKQRAKTTKRKFYSLKDAWIERHQDDLIEGRRVREESLTCNRCHGEGAGTLCDLYGWPGWDRAFTISLKLGLKPDLHGVKKVWYTDRVFACPKCDGTGKYRSWWLYLHVFDIEGQRYSFHSYVEPSELIDEPGEDLESYGGRFSDEELDELALPITGLLKVLGHVAHERWGMVFSVKMAGGRYTEPWWRTESEESDGGNSADQ